MAAAYLCGGAGSGLGPAAASDGAQRDWAGCPGTFLYMMEGPGPGGGGGGPRPGGGAGGGERGLCELENI